MKSWNDLSDRWKKYFTQELKLAQSMSKDEDTKVGAILVNLENKVVVSKGWNDLPRGIKHTKERNSRPLKYIYTMHAEQNCIVNALRLNLSVDGLTMISTLGACPTCACSVVNSGLIEFVSPTPDYSHISCGNLYKHTVDILSEGGVSWIFDDEIRS